MSGISSGEIGSLELVERTISDARELVRLEIALAKEDLQRELKDARLALISAGIAFVLALLGVTSLVVALGLAFGPLFALALGIVVALIAVGLACVALQRLPKKPLNSTVQRLRLHESIVGEHLS
jgi:uncharacterized membrane protein YqjE